MIRGVPYSMHDVINAVVDKGSFLEEQIGFARNAIVGLARFDGMPVGIVAQEPSVMAGVVDIDAADKIARFVRFCDAFNLPLVTFVDSPRVPARCGPGTRWDHPARRKSPVRVF